MNLQDAVKEARNKKANFNQTFDLIISLKNLDLKKTENRVKATVTLPKGTGKPRKIGIIANTLIPQTTDLENVIVITKDDLEKMDKKRAKNLASAVGMFIAEAPLMPLVGKNMGQVLAPRDMMPKPVPPTLSDLKPLLERLSKEIDIAIKKSPVAQAPIGTEAMSDEDVAANAKAVINAITNALPRGKEQIREVLVKVTMGKPVKVSSW